MNDKSMDYKNEVIISLNKYSNMVFRLAFARTKNNHDANDIMQEVFLRYMKNKKEFKDEEHKKAWLIKTTINCSKTLLTSAWFRKTTSLEDNIVEELKEKSEVYYALLKLSKKYRTVIHLFYYEDMSIAEISSLLNIKESTIKSQLNRARNKLKEILKEEEF
ncbi:MAG: RNA polymerase sigma factor [Clostridium sp.]